MPTNRDILKSAQASAVASTSITDAPAEVAKAHRRTYSFTAFDNADADTATPEMAHRMPVACRVVAIYITAPIAVTGHATTNAVFTVAKRTGAGAATTIGTLTTTLSAPANSLAAFVPKAVTITAADAELAAEDVLTFKMTKGSTGVAVTEAASATLGGSACIIDVVVEEI